MTISFKSFLEDFFRAAFSKISSLYYLRLSGNVLIGLLGGHSCGTFQTNPIINRRFITRESSSKAVKAVNCYSYHLLKVDPSGSVTRVIEAECRQRAENKKPNRRRPTNERSSLKLIFQVVWYYRPNDTIVIFIPGDCVDNVCRLDASAHFCYAPCGNPHSAIDSH